LLLNKFAPLFLVAFSFSRSRGWNAAGRGNNAIGGMRCAFPLRADGKLDFGTWEQIFYGEFDGCRKKRVLVKIIGE